MNKGAPLTLLKVEHERVWRREIFSTFLEKPLITLAKTANVFARVEPAVKKQAEEVLERLGIPMSNAVDMFLRMVALQRGIPFEIRLPQEVPLAGSKKAAGYGNILRLSKKISVPLLPRFVPVPGLNQEAYLIVHSVPE